MYRRRNDIFTCWLCDYGWVLIVLFTTAGALFLSKNYLQRLSSPQDHSDSLLTDIPSTVMVSTALSGSYTKTPTLTIPTPTSSPTNDNGLKSGYVNRSGGYALNYPAQWRGTELETDIQFVTNIGAMVYVHVEPHVDDLITFSGSMQAFPYDIRQVIGTFIDGQPARCMDVTLPESSILTSISCFTLDGQKGFVISLAELGALTQDQLQAVQSQFMDLLSSFRFSSSR